MTPEDAKQSILPGLKEALLKELNIPKCAFAELHPSTQFPGKYDVTLTIRGMPTLEEFKQIETLHRKCGSGHPDNKFGYMITAFV